MSAEFDEFMLTKFEKDQLDVMCDIENEHQKCVVIENGKIVMCLVLNKASCGFSQSVMLRCKILSSSLIDLGFVLSPCAMCVASKDIEGS